MASEVPQAVLDYLASEKTVTLATTSSDGTPHASTFLYVNDGLSIFIWARSGSTTVRNIRENQRVSFTIDEYVSDLNKAKGIQGNGDCQAVTGDEMALVVGLFGDKFPSPSSSASTANINFFKISPNRVNFIDNSGGGLAVTQDEFGAQFYSDVIFSD
jgi:uncharacterized protein YhbP (UPF0306 family)